MEILSLNRINCSQHQKIVLYGIHWKHIRKFLILSLAGFIVLSSLACASNYCTTSSLQDGKVFGVSMDKGCRVYSPSVDPTSDVLMLGRGETKSLQGITVTATVLSDGESEEIFGVDLDNNGIQPVWLRIENRTDQLIRLVPVALDPDYFFPLEAAYLYHNSNIPFNKAIDKYFDSKSINRDVPPGSEESGFIYTTWDPGVKYVNVMLYGDRWGDTFVFTFEIPGIRTDYQRVDWDSLYSDDEIVEIEDVDELRKTLESIPCCTTRKDGSGENDPLNFFVIGHPDDIFSAFIRQGWDVTEPISLSSGWRAFKAFFTGARYRTSPMSSLYVYNRPQDVGLQKARSTIHERNHLRLWLTPIRFRGDDVWIGAISRDTGSYFTTKTPWLTAHAIDPDIDEARSYLFQDLVFSEAVKKVGFVGGIKPATPENPHRNFMDQPWWTDGDRAVFLFGKDPTTLSEVEWFPWVWRGEQKQESAE